MANHSRKCMILLLRKNVELSPLKLNRKTLVITFSVGCQLSYDSFGPDWCVQCTRVPQLSNRPITLWFLQSIERRLKDNQNHHVSADQLAHRPRVYRRVNDRKLRLNSKYDVRTCYQNVSQQATILLRAPLNQSTKDKSYESDRHSP